MIPKKTTHNRISSMLKRLDAELTSTIKEWIEQLQSPQQKTLEFNNGEVYLASEDAEGGDTFWGINLQNGKIIFIDESGNDYETAVEELSQKCRLDIMDELAKEEYELSAETFQ